MERLLSLLVLILSAYSFLFISSGMADTEENTPGQSDATVRFVIAEHSEIACGDCHKMLANIDCELPGDALGAACNDCHSGQKSLLSDGLLPFHSKSSRNCIDCHSFHETGEITVGNQSFNYSGVSQVRFLCQTCHNSSGLENLSQGHRMAAELYHLDSHILLSQSPSATCQQCHARARSQKADSGDIITAIHINSSASHPIGIKAVPKVKESRPNSASFDIPLLDSRLECQSCHRLNSGSKMSLMSTSQQYDFCLSCH